MLGTFPGALFGGFPLENITRPHKFSLAAVFASEGSKSFFSCLRQPFFGALVAPLTSNNTVVEIRFSAVNCSMTKIGEMT